MYRPVGRPHFGGHIERLNRTLMERCEVYQGRPGHLRKVVRHDSRKRRLL
jgi:hypothetical protein